MTKYARNGCLFVLVSLALHSCAVSQVTAPDNRHASAMHRVMIIEGEAYSFGQRQGEETFGPSFIRFSLLDEGGGQGERWYNLWSWPVHLGGIPMRWAVHGTTLYTAIHADYGPGGQPTSVTRWPIGLMIPGRGAMLDLNDGAARKVADACTGFSINPVSVAMMGGVELTQTGYRQPVATGYRGSGVYFDFQVLDEKRVELLMTIDGRPSLWEYDGTQDEKGWQERVIESEKVGTAPSEPRLARRGWHHKKNLSVTIDGPFLWMQDPQYVVAEREGMWCVIGPLHSDEPHVRPIIAKDADKPLILVEDVMAKRNYFRLGDKLMDDRGAVIERVDASKPLDDQMREVVSKVVLRRRDR